VQNAVEKNLGKPLDRRPISTSPLSADSINLPKLNGDGYALPLFSLGQGPDPRPLNLPKPDISAVQGIRRGNLMSGVGKITKNNDLSKIKMIISVWLAYPPMLRKIRLCPRLQKNYEPQRKARGLEKSLGQLVQTSDRLADTIRDINHSVVFCFSL